jgi:hypothetical protein
MLIDSTQTEMINFKRNEIMCLPLYRLFPPATAIPAMSAIDNIFKNGLPIYHAYSIGDHSFICLLEKIDNNTVAIHEVFDDPDNRQRLKKFLWTASGNFRREPYRKDVG